MDPWNADKRTDKEHFFDGLYSIPKLDSDDTLETSTATLLLAASRDQRKTVPNSIPRRFHASTATLDTPVAPATTGASTMPTTKPEKIVSAARASLPPPDPTVPQSPPPPPESSRMLSSSAVAGKAEKRKRVTKTVPALSQKNQIFKNLYFYFIPNDLKNPARKFRVQKTDEHGGFCLNEWREKNITHVIVDARLRYEDVLKYLKKEKIPERIVIVNETFIGDCLDFNRIVNFDQPQYKVAGHVQSSPASSQSPYPATSSTSSLELGPSGSREISHSTQDSSIPYSMQSRRSEMSQEETPVIPAATPNVSPTVLEDGLTSKARIAAMVTPGVYVPALQPTSEQRVLEELSSKQQKITATITPHVASLAPQPTSEQRAPMEINRPRDDLDMMIEEALKMGNLPSLEDDESENKHASTDNQDTSSDEEESLNRAKRAKFASKRTRAEKMGGWQGTFQCMQKNDGMQGDGNPNKRTIEVLSEMQKYYEMTKDQWRSISYRKAINTLKKQERKIVFASEAMQLNNIGSSIAEKIEEIVRTDHLRKLEYAKLDPADAALKLFLGVYGVGPSLAHQWVQMGYKTLEDVKAKVKLSESQKVGVDHYDDFNCRIPREEVKQHGDVVMRIAALMDPALELEVLGSYRRGAKDCGDIDIMITKEGADAHWLSGLLDELVEKLFAVDFLKCRLASSRGRDDGSKWHGASKLPGVSQWRRIDLLVVPWDERGAALLYFTGNDIFNRSMRLLASKKGYGLNQRGLFRDVLRGPRREKLTDGTKVEGKDEKRIFEILGVPYRTPEERIC